MVETAGRCDWLRLLLCLHSWTAAPTTFFHLGSRESVELKVIRHDQATGHAFRCGPFSLDGLW